MIICYLFIEAKLHIKEVGRHESDPQF